MQSALTAKNNGVRRDRATVLVAAGRDRIVANVAAAEMRH